jgi:DEAD/DEAH box helicase
MQIFEFRNEVVGDYREYIESFISIADPKIRRAVDEALQGGLLWRDPLVQINPNFAPGKKIDDLIEEQLLHPESGRIFRRSKKETNGSGYALNLHLHQEKAVRLACAKKNYIFCTGTGSGKSLSCIIPIADHVLRTGSGQGIKAIILYPITSTFAGLSLKKRCSTAARLETRPTKRRFLPFGCTSLSAGAIPSTHHSSRRNRVT